MKKFLGLIFTGAMIFGGVGTVQALDIQPRGPQLDPVTRSTTKPCYYRNSVKIFSLKHSARFVPNNLGTSCSVQNHKVDAVNIINGVYGVILQKDVSDDGFTAYGRATSYYVLDFCQVNTQLDY